MHLAKKKQQQELDNTHPVLKAEEKYENREQEKQRITVTHEGTALIKAMDKQTLSEVSVTMSSQASQIVAVAWEEKSIKTTRAILKDGLADLACRKLAAENYIKLVKEQMKFIEEEITKTWNEEEMPLLQIMMEGE